MRGHKNIHICRCLASCINGKFSCDESESGQMSSNVFVDQPHDFKCRNEKSTEPRRGPHCNLAPVVLR